jgi:hypothetical protein
MVPENHTVTGIDSIGEQDTFWGSEGGGGWLGGGEESGEL